MDSPNDTDRTGIRLVQYSACRKEVNVPSARLWKGHAFPDVTSASTTTTRMSWSALELWDRGRCYIEDSLGHSRMDPAMKREDVGERHCRPLGGG